MLSALNFFMNAKKPTINLGHSSSEFEDLISREYWDIKYGDVSDISTINESTITFKPALGLTQSLIQRVSGALSLEVKQPGHEANHSPPSTAKVKNVWSYTSAPPICLHGMVLS
jgi:hypothetical protein